MAFAELPQLEAMLGRDLSDEAEQVADLLDAATVVLRDAIGAHVYPQDTVTVNFKVAPHERWIMLPQQPATVSAVQLNGEVLDQTYWELVDGAVYLHRNTRAAGSMWASVDVTFTYGFNAVPEELSRYCLVLAAQMFNAAEQAGGPSTSGLQSRTESIDDWSETVAYATGDGVPSSFELPGHIASKLRAKYGGDTVVVAGGRWP